MNACTVFNQGVSPSSRSRFTIPCSFPLLLLARQYVGPIRHKKGIASWAMVLIKRLYPEVKGVEFVTNRTRDRTDW